MHFSRVVQSSHDVVPIPTSPKHARWLLWSHESCSMWRKCAVLEVAMQYLEDGGHNHWPQCDICRLTEADL